MKKDTLVLRRTLLAVLVGAVLAGCDDDALDQLIGENKKPVAVDSAETVAEGAKLISAVPAATDEDGRIESYQLVDDVQKGSLFFGVDGRFRFVPGAAFDYLADGETDVVTFTYTATDDEGAVSEPKTVTITVTGITAPGEGGETEPGEFKGITATDGKAVIYYTRKDGKYDDWGLHLWNNDNCTSVEDTQNGQQIGQWDNPVLSSGQDEYGAYFELDLLADTDLKNGCVNFILHKGNDKDISSGDLMLKFEEFPERQIFLQQGNPKLLGAYEPLKTTVEGAKAHWVSQDTLLWNEGAAADVVELYFSANADIEFDDKTKKVTGGQKLTLGNGALSAADAARFPHLAEYGALQVNATDAFIASMLKGQLVAVAKTADGEVTDLTQVQIPGVLDSLYGDAATEKQLGAVVDGSAISFGLWAPTAKSVRLVAYNADKTVKDGFPADMSFDEDSGVWEHDGIGVEEFDFYRYEVSVYHPATRKLEMYEVTDPYSLSLAANSKYSQVVDLDHIDTKPAGWDADSYKWEKQPEDMVIYESHIRDFSVYDSGVRPEYKGKYLAFSESDSHGMKHLEDLAGAGLTHFHLLPAFDIATVDEEIEQVNLDSTVGDLCGAYANAMVCGVEDSETTIRDVMESYVDESNGDTDKPQALMNDLRMLDSFNWGYDPFHYTVPEGGYATDAEGVQRIVEFRQMVMDLHETDLGVIMDVVYNHTNASGVGDKSVLDKIVPGYYHRLNPTSGLVETSTCCENTASEHVMMEKLMIDSLVTWTEDYGIDAFRFDLMGHHMKANMEKALAAVREVNPATYFYGEGWNFGEVASGARGENAIQWSMAGTGVGTFSDRMRDAVRGGTPFDGQDDLRINQGFANGLGVENLRNDYVTELDKEGAIYNNALDLIRLGMAGNLQNYVLIDADGNGIKGSKVDYLGNDAGYALDPQETINYVSKHDNQTLWDNNQYKIASHVTSADRARMQVIGLSFPLLSQGIPFIHMGSEMLRSKSMQRDSYDSGDWFNAVNWDSSMGNNWNVGLPRKDKDGDNWDLIREIIQDPEANPTQDDIEFSKAGFMALMQVRQSTPLLRLQTAEEIIKRVDFHNTGEEQVRGLIAMSIDDGTGLTDLDAKNDAIVVMINASDAEISFPIEGASNFELHSAMAEYAAGADFVDGEFTMPALTAAVFVKPQGDEQGTGVPVSQKDLGEQLPFGETAVYLRGDMNGWDTSMATEFVGNGTYAITVTLDAGSYGFKFADANWGSQGVNYGFHEVSVAEGSLALTEAGGNLVLDVSESGDYLFSFDATNTAAPVLAVTQIVEDEALVLNAPYGDTQIFVKGDMNEWSNADALQYAFNGYYVGKLQLIAGTYGFKLADADWAVVNIGAGADGGDVVVGETLTLEKGDNPGNLSLTVDADGEYSVVLDASDADVPVLNMFQETSVYGETGVLLRGDMNGWDESAAFSQVVSNGYILDVELTAGTYGFKLASSDWSTVNIGAGAAGHEVIVDGALALEGGDNPGNLSVTIETDGWYRFVLEVTSDSTSVLSLIAH